MVISSKPDILCIQETKLAAITSALTKNILAPDFADNFGFLPAEGTRGGILIAANDYPTSAKPNRYESYYYNFYH
jgi:exonuclease III